MRFILKAPRKGYRFRGGPYQLGGRVGKMRWHMVMREEQPRLAKEAFPPHPAIRDSRLLRGASPQEVYGDLARWFAAQHKGLPTPQRVFLSKSERRAALALIQHFGVLPEEVSEILQSIMGWSNAKGQVWFNPQVYRRLAAKDLGTRLLGARTIFHELSHVARPYPAVDRFVEEGTVSLYTHYLLAHAFALTRSGLNAIQITYPSRSQGMLLILANLYPNPTGFWVGLRRIRTQQQAATALVEFLMQHPGTSVILGKDHKRPLAGLSDEEWLGEVQHAFGTQPPYDPWSYFR